MTLDQVLLEVFDDDAAAIGEDTVFTDVTGWDSLKHVALVVAIETRFDVDLDAAEIARLTSKRATRDVLVARGLHA
jgi:acyl carrier protein